MNKRTLLLNGDFQPTASIPWQRAVILVLTERAEILEADEQAKIRSASLDLPFPLVIRLKRYVRVPFSRRVPVTRRAVMHRDKGTCGYCSRKASTIDHIRPRGQGGRHTWKNVVAACRECNERKAMRTPEEAGMPLLIKPTEPQGTKAFAVAAGPVEDCWEPYLAVA